MILGFDDLQDHPKSGEFFSHPQAPRIGEVLPDGRPIVAARVKCVGTTWLACHIVSVRPEAVQPNLAMVYHPEEKDVIFIVEH